MISKKAAFVKRSKAAKKGWITRRAKKGGSVPQERGKKKKGGSVPQERGKKKWAAEKRKLLKQIASLKKQQKAEKRREYRERSAIRKAAKEKEFKRMVIEQTKETRVKDLAIGRNLVSNGLTNLAILGQFPEKDREEIKLLIVQGRLDFGAALYGDIRGDAFDLADDFDWDISDIYDAWTYDDAA
jgi:hypothetical protein